jgi:hypothetical protein
MGLVLEWVYGTIVSTAEKARDGAKRALGQSLLFLICRPCISRACCLHSSHCTLPAAIAAYHVACPQLCASELCSFYCHWHCPACPASITYDLWNVIIGALLVAMQHGHCLDLVSARCIDIVMHKHKGEMLCWHRLVLSSVGV